MAAGVREVACGLCFRVLGTVARITGRVAEVARAPGALFLVAGAAWRWSGGMRQGVDAFPGGHDVIGLGLRGLDPQAPLAATAG